MGTKAPRNVAFEMLLHYNSAPDADHPLVPSDHVANSPVPAMSSSVSPGASSPGRARLLSIDALRGWVIVVMLLDHVRETVFLHHQVSDPMSVSDTDPALFFSRLLAHLCAPVFVFLTGLSAWLYSQKAMQQPGAMAYAGTASAAGFLFKRGLFLVVLEVLVINFAWTLQFPPSVVYLQVIWAIGLSMMALSALIWLPRGVLAALCLALVAGHNLLDGVHFEPGHALHVMWAILHDRGWIDVTEGMRLRTSYPVLPWIGVIALGYAAGPWFSSAVPASKRLGRLWIIGAGALLSFVVLRVINGYGQSQKWDADAQGMQALMSFVNITKYPPSLLFLLLTLGIGLILLALFEARQNDRWIKTLCAFGAAPMFFYILHLYVLKAIYELCVALWGLNYGKFFGVETIGQVWLITIVMAVVLYWPVRWFGALNARRRDIAWLKYL